MTFAAAVSLSRTELASVSAAQATGAQPSAPLAPRALLDTYCVTCHNQRTKTAGLTFDTMDLAKLPDHADVWEKTVRKLRGGMMPPPGVRRPDQASVDAMVSWLERSLDEAAAARPNPGRVALHRLNRAEYANAIEDLLALKIDAAALLPKDDEAEGFDNVASVLTVSPSFLDQYISAARIVSARAVGNPGARPASATYRPARGTDQSVRVDGLPLGTRGGLLVEHLFPADGDYKLNVPNMAIAGYVRGMEYRHTLVVTLDGVKVFENTIGGEDDIKAIDQQQAPAVAAINSRFMDIPVKVTAGPHKVGVMFVARTFAEPDEVLHSFKPSAGEDRIRRVGSLEIQGPVQSDRRQRDAKPCARVRVPAEEPAAMSFRARRRSFRQSRAGRTGVRSPMRDLEAPMAFYGAARAMGDFDTAIRDALPTILASPKFLYRAERSPAGLAPGSVHPIGDVELASRLVVLPDRPRARRRVAGRGRAWNAVDTGRTRGAGAAAAG